MTGPTRSLWADLTPEGPPPEPLDGDAEADVVIVGAGLTGLWTARSLLVADPGLSVLVLEAETVGFGASGRNGGWSSALFPTSMAGLARRHGEGPALAMRRAMVDAVAVVGAAAADEGIDCAYERGGTVTVARSPAQLPPASASPPAGCSAARGSLTARASSPSPSSGAWRRRCAVAAPGSSSGTVR